MSELHDMEHDLLSIEPKTKIILVTPESLKSCLTLSNVLMVLHRKKLVRIIVDEAHCITDCGHSYRED